MTSRRWEITLTWQDRVDKLIFRIAAGGDIDRIVGQTDELVDEAHQRDTIEELLVSDD